MSSADIESLARVSELRDTVLKAISYSVLSQEAELSLEHWSGTRFSVYLRGVLHISISTTDETVTESVVMNAKAELVRDGGKEALGELGYMWLGSDGEVKSYSGRSLVRFRIEGDTCIGAVCRELEFKSNKSK